MRIPTISFIRSGLLLKSGKQKVYEKALISEVYLLVYISQEEHRQAQAELCQAQTSLTLSVLGGAGTSIFWGGQIDQHFLTAPRGLIGP